MKQNECDITYYALWNKTVENRNSLIFLMLLNQWICHLSPGNKNFKQQERKKNLFSQWNSKRATVGSIYTNTHLLHV